MSKHMTRFHNRFLRLAILAMGIAVFGLFQVNAEGLKRTAPCYPEEGGSSGVKKVYVIDAAQIDDPDEIFLLTSIQGIVNKRGPRLFVKAYFHKYGPEEEIFMKYLTEVKGFQFEWIQLADALKMFADAKYFKGYVRYQSKNYEQGCVAVTLAGLNDTLPLCDRTEQHATPLLSRKDLFYESDFTRVNNVWLPLYAKVTRSPEGVWFSKREGVETLVKAERAGLQAVIEINTEHTPLLEIDVSEVKGTWSLFIDQGATHNGKDSCVWLERDTTKKGVLRYDLTQIKDIVPGSRRAIVRFVVPELTSSILLKRFRLMTREGKVPEIQDQKLGRFPALPVEMDLAAKFPDSESLWSWAVSELLPRTSTTYAFAAQPGWYNTRGLDLAVLQNAFVFQKFDNKRPVASPYEYPLLDSVLNHLKRPGIMLGWIGEEWTSCTKLTAYGHSMFHSGAANLSFWARVPTSGDVKLPRNQITREPLKNKFYVCWSVNPGDTANGFMSLYWNSGNWCDPNRGKVPMIWLLNPVIQKVVPAVTEYFASTATAKDTFMIPPTGAGYTYPGAILGREEVLRPFMEESRRLASEIGLEGMVVWDPSVHRPFAGWYQPGREAPVKLFAKTLSGSKQGPHSNIYLEDGTPVILVGNKASYGEFKRTYHYNNMDRSSDFIPQLVNWIKNVAKENAPPLFIFTEEHLTPTEMKSVAEQLPGDQFEVIGSSDLVRLARESASLVVTPYTTSVSPNERFYVEVSVYNPDGAFNHGGEIRMVLPPEFSCPVAIWKHAPVEKGGAAKHLFEITAAGELTPGERKIDFFHSKISHWNRSARFTCYPGAMLAIETKDRPGEWQAQGAVKIVRTGGLVEFRPLESRNLHDYCLVRDKKTLNPDPALLLPMTINFDANPVLELNLYDVYGKFSLSITDENKKTVHLYSNSAAIGITTLPLSDATQWKGTKNVVLTLKPRINHGGSLLMRSLKIHYEKR